MRDRDTLLDQFWRAQATIGLSVVSEVLAAWPRVSPLDIQRTGRDWLSTALTVIRGGRTQSRSNAVAFMRLYRALETGYTLPAPGEISPSDTTTLGELRDWWAGSANIDRRTFPDDSAVITVEPFDWPDADESVQDDRAVTSLVATGLARVHQVTRPLGDDAPRLDDPSFLADLETIGRSAANVAQRETLRGGRELVDSTSERDDRALGWMRVTDGNPCHFCALLATRGVVYKSKRAAGQRRNPGSFPAGWRSADRDELKKYHPRCACEVVPVYTRDDPRVAESRRLYDEYRDVTQGKSGAAARRAWRHHIEARSRQ